MIAGKLDIRITVRQATTAQATNGEFAETWADYMANEPAQFTPAGGNDGLQADQKTATIGGKFLIRSSATSRAITQAMQITYDSLTWAIINIDKHTRNDRIEITAQAIY